MAIIIKHSNKTQIPLKTTVGGKTSFTGPKSIQSGYIPFIDKISITLQFPYEDAAAIYANVEKAVSHKAIFQWAVGLPNFKYAKYISCAGTAERVLFHFGAKGSGTADCRLEFNPHKIGYEGIFGLDSVLALIFPDGWGYVIKRGRVSRIDVAVDIPGIRMDEFLFLDPQGRKQRTYTRDGHLETIYAGLRKGNQARIYSKSKEMKAKGTPLSHSVVRVEYTLRNTNLYVHQLLKLANPFAKLVMTLAMPPPPSWEDGNRWSCFCDSIIVRGLTSALALQPEKRRAKYRKYLKEAVQPWWDPKAIWKNWPKAVLVLK